MIDMANGADFFLYLHDWKKQVSQSTVFDCIAKCNRLCNKATPKAIIGTKAETFLRKKQGRPTVFEKLVVEDGSSIAEFDFDASKAFGLEDFIPFVIEQVVCDSGSIETTGFSPTAERSSTDPRFLLPYKVLVPKNLNTIHPTKLNCVSVPVNCQLNLGRSEMLKKNAMDRRISKQNHLQIYCSDVGKVAVEALNKTMLILKAPHAHAAKLIQ
eukprot:scaffold111243_cov54-Attheya_sp.AAC.1